MSQRARMHLVVVAYVILGAFSLGSFAGDWPWTRWKVECRDPANCEPAPEIYEELLEHASIWLDGLGFGAPKVTKHRSHQDAAGNPNLEGEMFYYAEVSDQKNAGKTESIGIYFPGSKEIFLRSDAYFTLGEAGDEHRDQDYRVAEHLTFTPVHELFHAVQSNYQDTSGTERDWIWEGTADAVLRVYAEEFEPEIGALQPARVSFNKPLHKSPSKADNYGTWFFWRNVGRNIDSHPSIRYIRDVLAEDLDDNNGLDGVDRALKAHGGLYVQLPRFFADLDIKEGMFGTVDEIQVALRPGQTREQKRFRRKVDMVAGTPHHLKVKGHPSGSGKPLEVEITFKQDYPELHLIVDGYEFDEGSLGPRNLYRDLLVSRDEEEYDIIVANVAEEAGKSKPRDYELEVNLREVGYCTMTARVSGDVGGSYFGDIAHFSTRGGATIYGAFSNPEMIAGVAEWLGGMAEMAGGEGAGEQVEKMREEMMAGSSEIPRETFGLSLSEQKIDADAEQSIAVLAGGFTLEASVIGPDVGEGVTGSIPLKMLRVVPGPRAESTLDKVPFVWVEGAPGSAQLFITRNTGDLVAGRIDGTLYAEGYYKPDGSAPVITVNASFVALEGPVGCMGPGVQLPF